MSTAHAYRVIAANGSLIWSTNNLPAAYRRADRVAGSSVVFNYSVRVTA